MPFDNLYSYIFRLQYIPKTPSHLKHQALFKGHEGSVLEDFSITLCIVAPPNAIGIAHHEPRP